MATLKIYKEKIEVPFAYHFVCEHCGKDSGMLTSKVEGERVFQDYTPPSPVEHMRMQVGAYQAATRQLRELIQFEKEGKYFSGMIYKCPHCMKVQSWELTNRPWRPLWYALAGFLGGWLSAMLLPHLAGIELSDAECLLIALAGFASCLAYGLFERWVKKRDVEKTDVRNKPEFLWPEVPDADIDLNNLITSLKSQSAICPQCGAVITYEQGAALAQKHNHLSSVMCGNCKAEFTAQLEWDSAQHTLLGMKLSR